MEGAEGGARGEVGGAGEEGDDGVLVGEGG